MKITGERYREIFNNTVKECQDLGIRKGGEYTGREGVTNVHANFDRLSDKLGVDPATILMVYLTKHLDSIDNYVKNKQLKVDPVFEPSEPMSGRINDAINYLILLKAMLLRDVIDSQSQSESSHMPVDLQSFSRVPMMWANRELKREPQQDTPNIDSYLGSNSACNAQQKNEEAVRRYSGIRDYTDASQSIRGLDASA